ncbi:MAG: HemK2/MTQ2 family protein methyltransferase [Solirubrobacteraceae bacterium]
MSATTLSRPTGSLQLRALPGVFRPRSDAVLLARVIVERGLAEGLDVLDVFTGSGVLAAVAGVCGASSVTAIDVSRRAVASARRNGRRNGVRVRALRGDLFEPVAGRQFDLITANPPYLPGPANPPSRGVARAWEGGPDGRVLVDRLCAAVGEHLRPGGRLLLVQSSLTGESDTCSKLTARGHHVEVLARQVGPLGPLARERLSLLRERGLTLGASHDVIEEIHVISAVRD